MAYVIAEPCLGVKDTACLDACPVDYIHPKKNTSYDDGRPASMKSNSSISIPWSALTVGHAYQSARLQPSFLWTICQRNGATMPKLTQVTL